MSDVIDPRLTCSLARRTTLPGPHTGKTDPTAALGCADSSPYRSQQGGGGAGQQTGADLLGGVVPRAALQWQLAERKARLTAGVISKGVMVFVWLW